jgi:transposase
MKQEKEEGHQKYRTSPGRPPKIKAEDLGKFQEVVEKRADQTMKEIAESYGKGVTAAMVGVALKKIGFTKKKRP